MNTNIFRSIAAIMIGAGVTIFLSVGADALMRAFGIFPVVPPMNNRLFILATLYRTVFGVLGAYLTGKLAPNKPMNHALILGVLGIVANAAGTIAAWNQMPSLGPKWYPIALTILALPQAWAGARLGLMQSGDQATGSSPVLPPS